MMVCLSVCMPSFGLYKYLNGSDKFSLVNQIFVMIIMVLFMILITLFTIFKLSKLQAYHMLNQIEEKRCQLTSIRESFKRKYKKHEVEKAMKSVD